MTKKNLSEELENSLVGSELKNVGLDIAEIAIDQFLTEGLLRDIPILNSVVALFKSGVSIKEALFIKKLLLFLKKIQEVSSEKREYFLIEISKVEKTKRRLFEKLLFTIDKLDDTEKALILGKAFKHLIVGNINLIQYYRISRVIEDMMIDEINYFFYEYGYLKHNEETREQLYYYMDLIGKNNLKEVMIRNGLFEIVEKLKFRENISPQQYHIEKKERLTTLGEIFRELGFEGYIHLKNPIN